MRRLLAPLLFFAAVLAGFAGCSVVSPTQSIASLVQPLTHSTVVLQDAEGRTYCSGVAVSKVKVVTAAHCVNSQPAGEKFYVRTFDGRVITAESALVHSKYDAAVLLVDEAILTPAKVGSSDSVVQGDRLLVIGHPYGVEWLATFGIASRTGYTTDFSPGRFIGSDAAMNPGNSGGPVFNTAGEVVAIVCFGRMGSGFGFALEVDQLKGTIL